MGMIEETLVKRQQTKCYSTKLPNKDTAEEIISKAFNLTASKQNLYPYKVHVLGPDQKDYKKQFYNIVRHQTGGNLNMNVEQAPYCLIFTNRLVKNPDPKIYKRIQKGHIYNNCDPKLYKTQIHNTAIEVGMFAKVLTTLVLEKNMDVSYTLCFPDYEKNRDLWKKLPFIDDTVIFSMQFGYRFSDYSFNETKEKKQDIKDVINWV